MNADQNTTNDWPAGERPIFIDGGFGQVNSLQARSDELGEVPRLSDGAVLGADASSQAFADSWATILNEKPHGDLRWEYAVQAPGSIGHDNVTPLPIAEALEAARLRPGTRLRRRAVGKWLVVDTPFPRVHGNGWAELESQKQAWFQVLMEFPPTYWGIISRTGGIDHVPDAWPQLARRAAVAGFTPAEYSLLGTALLAHKARDAAENRPLSQIELWAEFPSLIREGITPLAAIARIRWKQSR